MNDITPDVDYNTLIDAQTWDFIHKTNSFYPADTIHFTIAQQRAVYNKMCAAFHKPHPAGVRSRDILYDLVPCRLYETGPNANTIIYFHGGGFVVGGLESHDDVCAEICAYTGFRVISVDYRLAPEHLHPAAFEDGVTAINAAFAEFGGQLILAGDSAGGALAACLTHHFRGRGFIRGQVLIYPGLGGNVDRGSYLRHANAPMLTRNDVLFYSKIRFKDHILSAADPTAAVLHDHDYSGLPPTVIFSAECDPLADDGRHYSARIFLAGGGQAEWILEKGLVHGYLRARHDVDRAKAGFERICKALNNMGA